MAHARTSHASAGRAQAGLSQTCQLGLAGCELQLVPGAYTQAWVERLQGLKIAVTPSSEAHSFAGSPLSITASVLDLLKGGTLLDQAQT